MINTNTGCLKYKNDNFMIQKNFKNPFHHLNQCNRHQSPMQLFPKGKLSAPFFGMTEIKKFRNITLKFYCRIKKGPHPKKLGL